MLCLQLSLLKGNAFVPALFILLVSYLTVAEVESRAYSILAPRWASGYADVRSVPFGVANAAGANVGPSAVGVQARRFAFSPTAFVDTFIKSRQTPAFVGAFAHSVRTPVQTFGHTGVIPTILRVRVEPR